MCTCEPTFNGMTVVSWVASAFNDCLYTWADISSFILGWTAILIWCICLFPQIWVNYTTKRVDGLSGAFVLEWTLGDAMNLMGCYLTEALPTQTYQAIYFVACDMGLLLQWLYYKRLLKTHISTYDGEYGSLASDFRDFERLKSSARQTLRRSSPGVYKQIPINQHLLTICMSIICLSSRVNAYEESPPCLDPIVVSKWAAISGTVVSWISGIFYFTSRFPQVLRNHRRKSTQGLSLLMFTFLIMGNAMYGLSILLRQPPINKEFFLNKLPFLVGSVGTFVFDITIFIQFTMYRKNRLQLHSDDRSVVSWYSSNKGSNWFPSSRSRDSFA